MDRLVPRATFSLLWALAMMQGAQAVEPFVGRWAIDPAGCVSGGDTSQTAPLYATPSSINWFVAHCTIGKMYKVGRAFHIQARCANEGRTVATPITLEPRGDRMRVTWDGAKVGDMRRCK